MNILVSVLISFILIIFAILFCIGYTNFRVNHLTKEVNEGLTQIEEGLLKIINNEESVFGDKFKNALAEAVHSGLEGLFDDPFDEIEKLEEVPLLIKINWEQKEPFVIFDFSEWKDEEKKGIIGVTIFTPFAQPENLKNFEDSEEEMPFMYPDATLRYVRYKGDENGIPFWIWDEQLYFMMALQEGLDIEDDE